MVAGKVGTFLKFKNSLFEKVFCWQEASNRLLRVFYVALKGLSFYTTYWGVGL